MKIITEPRIYVLGKQVVQDAELARFLEDVGHPDWATDGTVPGEVLVELGARTCYQSWGKGRPHAEHLHHLIEVGHGSCLEHSVWNLLITGVSRSLTHELIRHRAGLSPSQLSQRYVDESVAEYVEPDIIAQDPELHAIWLDAVQHAHESYVRLAEKLANKLNPIIPKDCPECGAAVKPIAARFATCGQLKHGHECCRYDGGKCSYRVEHTTATERRKAARQAARSVLPNATETKVFVTANARALRNIVEQRGSAGADPEIRKLANALLDVLQADSPSLFGDYRKVPLPDGTYSIETDFRKV